MITKPFTKQYTNIRPPRWRNAKYHKLAASVWFTVLLFLASADLVVADNKSPSEIADAWVKEQGFAPKVIPDLIEDVSEPMAVIINRVASTIRYASKKRGKTCNKAALMRADYISNEATRSRLLRGALKTGIDALTAIPNVAKNLGEFIKDKTKEQIKKLILDKLSAQSPEAFSMNVTVGDCKTSMRIVWNKKKMRYAVFITGDCDCKKVVYAIAGERGPKPRKTRLRKWTVTAEGTIKVGFKNGKPKIYVPVLAVENLKVKADCSCTKTSFLIPDRFPYGYYCSLWPDDGETWPGQVAGEETLLLTGESGPTISMDTIVFGTVQPFTLDSPQGGAELVAEEDTDADFDPVFSFPAFPGGIAGTASDLVWLWAAFLEQRYPEGETPALSRLEQSVGSLGRAGLDSPPNLTDGLNALDALFIAEFAYWLDELAHIEPGLTIEQREDIAENIIELEIIGITEREFLPVLIGFDTPIQSSSENSVEIHRLDDLTVVMNNVWEHRFGTGTDYCPPTDDSPVAILGAIARMASGAVDTDILDFEHVVPLTETSAFNVFDVTSEKDIGFLLDVQDGRAQSIPTIDGVLAEPHVTGGVVGEMTAAYLSLRQFAGAAHILPKFLGSERLESIETVNFAGLLRRHAQPTVESALSIPAVLEPATPQTMLFDSSGMMNPTRVPLLSIPSN